MLPTPLTNFWSSRARLIPVRRRRSAPRNATGSNAGSSGSGAMCRMPAGCPAPPVTSLATTARPPKVRLVFLAGGHELRYVDQRTFGGLAAHAQVGLEDVPGVQRQPQVLTAPAGGFNPAAGQQGDEVGFPGKMAPDRPRMADSHRGYRPPDDSALQALPHHLDLGQLGH